MVSQMATLVPGGNTARTEETLKKHALHTPESQQTTLKCTCPGDTTVRRAHVRVG